MLGANAGVTRIDYLSLARNETPKKLYLLKVDFLGVLRTKKTLFG
jgi:hypothetical protein